MDIAIVTGAERGIGLQIARKLISLGFRVYGFAQDFSKCPFEHPDFLHVACDLTSTSELESAWAQLVERDPMVSVVVNAAQQPLPESFEASPLEAVEHALQTELLCPLVLTRLALPSLIKFHGFVINIAWSGQGEVPGGAVNAATQAGLHFFARQLFEEVRDTGVKVSTLYPELNAGDPDPKARISMEPQSGIEAPLFAEAVEAILRFKENNCISQIVVRPQGTREEPKIPASVTQPLKAAHGVQLPERKYFPVEAEPIATPPRERPEYAPEPGEDDEWDEEEEDDDELDRMLAESRELINKRKVEARKDIERIRERKQGGGRKGDRNQSRGNRDNQGRDNQGGGNQGDDSGDQGGDFGNQSGGDQSDNQQDGGKKRRRRRRGGRGRRNRGDQPNQGQRDDQDSRDNQGSRDSEGSRDSRGNRDDGNRNRGDRSNRRDDRRQQQDRSEQKDHRSSEPRPQSDQPKSSRLEDGPSPSKIESPKSAPPPSDPPKKKVAKKAVKKTAKKAAKKATKKAAKKATKKAAKKATKKAVKKAAPKAD